MRFNARYTGQEAMDQKCYGTLSNTYFNTVAGSLAFKCLDLSHASYTTLCLHRVIVMQKQCYAVVLVMIILILIGVIS